MEIPDLCRALANLKHLDPKIDTDNGVYFAARDLIVRKPGHGAARSLAPAGVCFSVSQCREGG